MAFTSKQPGKVIQLRDAKARAANRNRRSPRVTSTVSNAKQTARSAALAHHREAFRLDLEGHILGVVPLGLPRFAELAHEMANGNGSVDWEVLVRREQLPYTADQTRKLWRILEWVSAMFTCSNKNGPINIAHLRRIDPAYEVISDLHGDTAKRRAIAHHVVDAVENAQGVGAMAKRLLAGSSSTLQANVRTQFPAAFATHLIEQLAAIDAKFGSLKQKKVSNLLMRTAVPAANIRGGAGKMAPTRLAALLTVTAGAFGDTNVEKSKRRYMAAEQSARR